MDKRDNKIKTVIVEFQGYDNDTITEGEKSPLDWLRNQLWFRNFEVIHFKETRRTIKWTVKSD